MWGMLEVRVWPTHRGKGRRSSGSWRLRQGPGWSSRPLSPPPTWTSPSSPSSSSPPSTSRTSRPASRSWVRARAWPPPSPRSSRRTLGSSAGACPCRSCGSWWRRLESVGIRDRFPYLNEPKGLSKGEKKSITEPLFFFDFAESFLFLVCIPSFFIVKGLGTCQGRNKNKYPGSGGAWSETWHNLLLMDPNGQLQIPRSRSSPGPLQ